jgi:hypothetical protein
VNNTLTRLLAVVLVIFVIEFGAHFLGSVQTSDADDILSKYGLDLEPSPEEENRGGRIPSFTEFIGGNRELTPEEYNGYRSKYISDFGEKIAIIVVGKKPKKNITDWNERKSNEEQRIANQFDQMFPAKKVDTFTDKAGNQARAFAGGIVGFGKSLTNVLPGGPGEVGQYLGEVSEGLREGMTPTEKIEAQRSARIKQAADEVGGLTSIWASVREIRATWVIEALAVPLILLELVFFRKIQRWHWPKIPAIQMPSWALPRRKTIWVEIPKEQAQDHRFYGIKYGLLFLLAYMILGPMAMWGSVNKELHKAQVSHSDFFAHSDAAPLVIAQMIIILLQSGVVMWAMLTKHPQFRRIATHAFAWYFPSVVVASLLFSKQAIGAVVATLVLGLVQWVIFSGLWVWYLQRSQRVRVTFEHTLKTYSPTNTVPTTVPEQETSIHADAVQTTSEIASTTVTEMATHASHATDPAAPNADVHSGAIDVKAITSQPSTADDEEKLWSQALAELDGSDRKQGLWAQCYATHHGQEPAARANYLKARVAQLRTDNMAKRDQTAV